MFASEGEILTLRPDGFQFDPRTIGSFLDRLPGTYHRPGSASWSLVVPSADLPRFIAILAERDATGFRASDPQWAEVEVFDDRIWIHPGLVPGTWARAQTVIVWLLGLGAWRVTGDTPGQPRDLGIIRRPSELFPVLYDDAEVPRLDPRAPTRSPPEAGELTTFRRYLTNPDDDDDYHHEFLRIHDSGAFSYQQYTRHDERRFDGQVTEELAAQVRALVSQLDVSDRSPGGEDLFADRVAVIIERPGASQEKVLDAEHPPQSYAPLVRLMNRWAESLAAGEVPAGFVDVRETRASAVISEEAASDRKP